MTRLSLLLLALIALCASCGRQDRMQLDVAQHLLDSIPDSALTILRDMDRHKMTRANRARHGLLLTIALDKNHMPLASDSVVSDFLNYYLNHDCDKNNAMLAWYYAGRKDHQNNHLSLAVHKYLEANNLAEQTGNFRYIGLSFRNIADIYGEIFHTNDVLEFRKKALTAFSHPGLEIYVPTAKIDLLAAYANAEKSDSALNLGYGLLSDSTIISDPELLNVTYTCMAKAAFWNNDYDLTASLIKKTEQVKNMNRTSTEWFIYILSLVKAGHIDTIKSLSHVHPDSLNHLELATLGDYKNAYKKFANYSLKNDSIIGIVQSQDVTSTVNEFVRTKEELRRNRLSNIIYILILSIIIILGGGIYLFINIRKRVILKNHEQEISRELAQNLASKLNSIAHNYEISEVPSVNALRGLISELELSSSKNETSKKTSERIYNKVSEIVDSYRPGGNSISKLSHFADTIAGNIIASLFASLPKPKPEDVALVTYLALGFDIPMICYLMNQKPENIYNRKSRLRSKLLKLNNGENNELLRILSI